MYSEHEYNGGNYRHRGQRSYRNNYRSRDGGRGDNSRQYRDYDDRQYHQNTPPRIEYNQQSGQYNNDGYQHGARGYYQGGGGGRSFGGYRGSSYRGNTSGSRRPYNGRGFRGGNYQPSGRRGGRYNNYNHGYQSGRDYGGRTNRGTRGYPRGQQHHRWQKNTNQHHNYNNSFHQEQNINDLPMGLSFCCDLGGHRGSVNCIVFDNDGGRLFTGGSDGLVRQWNTENGQIEHTSSYNGEITAMLLESNYFFVAVHCMQDQAGPQGYGDLHIYNLEAQSEQKFMAHMGRILTLHLTGDVLLSAGEDAVINGWKFSEETKLFNNLGSFKDSGNGHEVPIHCMATISRYLFSGDGGGVIRVWNMDTGALVQRVNDGHRATISSMLCCDNALIAGSLDKRISLWTLNLDQETDNVVQRPPRLHSEARDARGYPAEVFALTVATDAYDNPLLMAGLGSNEVVLYELPNFTIKGRIQDIHNLRSLTAVSRSLLLIGQENGSILIFSWEDAPPDEDKLFPLA